MSNKGVWCLDYNYNAPASSSSSLAFPDPPGYISTPTDIKSNLHKDQHLDEITNLYRDQAVISLIDLERLRAQKAWEVAYAPAKNVPMQAFMMYMTGGGVQIFSVMSVWFLLRGAVTGMMSVESTFAPFTSTPQTASATNHVAKEDPSAKSSLPPFFFQKSTYFICQFALLLVGLWKCNAMGLLPTHDSDFLAFKLKETWIT